MIPRHLPPTDVPTRRFPAKLDLRVRLLAEDGELHTETTLLSVQQYYTGNQVHYICVCIMCK